MPSRQQPTKIRSGGGKLLLRRKSPLTRRSVAYFHSGAHIGRRGDSIALYQQRKSTTRAGAKLPDNLRNAGVKFKELADSILVFSAAHHKDTRTLKNRLSRLRADFDQRKADTVMPQEIDDWLTVITKTPATSNRYRALFSLIYVRPYGMETQANLEVQTGAAIRAAGSPAA